VAAGLAAAVLAVLVAQARTGPVVVAVALRSLAALAAVAAMATSF
jgi:hypothetical protein